ncbi:unnamed protein product [Camellia sinensis]
MDVLIQIAQSSILETPTAEPNDQTNDGSSPNTQKVATDPETHAANSDHKLSSDSGPNELKNEDCMTTRAPDLGFSQHDGKYIMTDNKRVNSDHISHVENNLAVVCTNTSDHPKLDQVEKHGNSEQEIGFGNSQLTTIHDVVTGTSGQIVEENVCQSGVADSSMPVVQSLPCFPLLTSISNKGENEFCTVDQKLDNVTAFDDLRLDEIEPLKFNFLNGQESPSLPEVTMNLANDEGMEEGFNSSAGFETEAIMLNIAGRLQFTTVCVWCRTEFNHEAVDSETQSDSVGFMCPTCKAKISGQLNVLDSAQKNACTINGTNEDSGGCSKPILSNNNIGVHLPKRAVLCGVSYQKKKHRLKGTINDVNRMKSLLTDHFGFLETSICVLTEEEDDPNLIPTKENMQKALRWLVADCKSGDSLVFYFSGHGLRQLDFDMDENDDYDETICPSDFMTAGMILDNDINNTIVKPLKEGVKLHAIIDACHSGTILDLEHVYDRKQ